MNKTKKRICVDEYNLTELRDVMEKKGWVVRRE